MKKNGLSPNVEVDVTAMFALRNLSPTAEVELLARAVAAERYARVLEAERPPIPLPPAVVRAIVRANRRLRDFATRN